MKSILLQICLIAGTTSGSLIAQTTYLSEDFTSGFPPAGWTNTVSAGVGWKTTGSRAWHEDESGGHTCDSWLISPAIDLSSAPEAYIHFAGDTYFSSYMANHPNGFGDGVSTVEVTTDGGATWDVLWTDTTTTDNTPYSPNLGLTPYLGSSAVQIAFHYYGTYAHEWWVDFLIVDDTPVPTLAQAVNPANGHPYTLLGQSDISAAQAVADAMGGHLVTISDQAENDWIRSQFSTNPNVSADLWLGYNDVLIEDTFVWSNGEVTGYENFASGEPNNSGNEDYVQMASTGFWNDTTGILMGHAVIEISEPSLQVTPLVASQLATFTSGSFPSGSRLAYVLSVNGAGPTNTPYGVLEVDLDIISPIFPDSNGNHSISTYVPPNLGGRTLYGQIVVFEPDGDVKLSNPIAEPIQ
ncbi:MAG: lectin-like protein [Planctomycetota bacterium]|jgi:hypothetical protein|nr:lectin-like protein [Planctomycetota bacterium]